MRTNAIDKSRLAEWTGELSVCRQCNPHPEPIVVFSDLHSGVALALEVRYESEVKVFTSMMFAAQSIMQICRQMVASDHGWPLEPAEGSVTASVQGSHAIHITSTDTFAFQWTSLMCYCWLVGGTVAAALLLPFKNNPVCFCILVPAA